MKSLINLFKTMKTLLNKVSDAKKVETKKKYQEELQHKLDDAITDRSWKQDLKEQEQKFNERAHQEKVLKKKLNVS